VLSLAAWALAPDDREIERVVREYLVAVGQHDAPTVVRQLAPGTSAEVASRVALQTGNRYRVLSLVVGRPAVAATSRHNEAWVDLLAEVTPPIGPTWRSTSTARLRLVDGRWRIVSPPFA
jgi:hypothetical protein